VGWLAVFFVGLMLAAFVVRLAWFNFIWRRSTLVDVI
jgi:hypothetical protein